MKLEECPFSSVHNNVFHIIFREEAQRVWEKREAQWEKEKKARERLMHEVKLSYMIKTFNKSFKIKKCSVNFLCKVLMGRQQQLEQKMLKIRKAQEESLKRREELIQELELERKLRRLEKETDEGQKTERMQELKAQVGTNAQLFCAGVQSQDCPKAVC